MALFVDSTAIPHGIQLAVAPVFLLSAVAGLIGAVAGRLSRIIDRGRVLEDRIRQGREPELKPVWLQESRMLRVRGMLANSVIGLLTLCGFLIGLTIVVLFLGETTAYETGRWAIYSFLAGIGCFMAALGCFFAETLLATRALDFGRRVADVP
jgi:hypothetical protein